MKKAIILLLILVSTSHSLSFFPEFLEKVDRCENGDTDLCLKIGKEREELEKDPLHRELTQGVYGAWIFYANACMQWSFEGCIGAVRTYKTKEL